MYEILTKENTLVTEQRSYTMRYALLQGEQAPKEFAVSVQNVETGEVATVWELTSDQQQAMEFFGRVTRGTVTPVSLREIAEDFVAQLYE
jgi:hypothetical protein